MSRAGDQTPRNAQDGDNTHRIKRARSWVTRSEEIKNREEKFVCLWIAFNAAYGTEGTDKHEYEMKKFKDFLSKIEERDKADRIRDILLDLDDKDSKRKPIRNFLENRHVYKDFWESVRAEREGSRQKTDWRKRFDEENSYALEALDNRFSRRNKNVSKVFRIVFERLYQLRNQVFHGGATCGENSWGWIQLEDANYIMADLVSVILDIMDQNPGVDWGKIAYPRVGHKPWIGDGDR